jgi:predicted alpha/beta hydrolase family esterase
VFPLHPEIPKIPVLILPGYGGSGPEHWQTLWEAACPEFHRVEQRDWDKPDCAEWVAVLQAAVHGSGPETVIVAHSLACLQVAHWALRTRLTVRGALLVAPPDPDAPAFPAAARSFAPVPKMRLPFPSCVVGSTNDPYATPEFTAGCARAWGGEYVSIGDAGHINASSGLGTWEAGLRLLENIRGKNAE